MPVPLSGVGTGQRRRLWSGTPHPNAGSHPPTRRALHYGSTRTLQPCTAKRRAVASLGDAELIYSLEPRRPNLPLPAAAQSWRSSREEEDAPGMKPALECIIPILTFICLFSWGEGCCGCSWQHPWIWQALRWDAAAITCCQQPRGCLIPGPQCPPPQRGTLLQCHPSPWRCHHQRSTRKANSKAAPQARISHLGCRRSCC